MGTPEFPDLGKHCAVDVCKQIDFLPLTCDRCFQVLCVDHRSYMKHDCPKGNRGDVTMDKHVNSVCDPSNDEKAAMKKKKCPVPRCREVLTFSYTTKCRACSIDHCLKHRFGPDHSCSGPKKPDSNFSSTNTKVTTSAPPSSSSSRSSSLLATAEARIRKKRLNPTRVRRDSSVVHPPLWMIREGVVLTREQRGEMSQEEEAAKFMDFKVESFKAYHNALLKQKGNLNQPESSGVIQSATTSSDLQVGMNSKREVEDKEDDDVEWEEYAPDSANGNNMVDMNVQA